MSGLGNVSNSPTVQTAPDQTDSMGLYEKAYRMRLAVESIGKRCIYVEGKALGKSLSCLEEVAKHFGFKNKDEYIMYVGRKIGFKTHQELEDFKAGVDRGDAINLKSVFKNVTKDFDSEQTTLIIDLVKNSFPPAGIKGKLVTKQQKEELRIMGIRAEEAEDECLFHDPKDKIGAINLQYKAQEARQNYQIRREILGG